MYQGDRAKYLLGSLEGAQRLGIWEWIPATDEMVWSDGLYDVLHVAPNITPSLEGLIATLSPSDRPRFKHQLSRARHERGLLAFRCHSDARRVLQVRMQRTVADDGTLRSIVGTSQDVTEEALANDATAAVATLAGALAHEINNPLAVISAALQMMPATSAGGEALLAVDRITGILADLNLYALGDRAPRTSLQLEHVIATAFARVANLDGRATVVSRLEHTIPVRGNPDTLSRVIVELIENALDAVTSTPLKEVRVLSRNDGREWSVVEIIDSGAGIPAPIQARVFDPFFTTKGVGRRGLGLPICRGIVESMGGSITIHSREGGGTRVVLALPTTASQPVVKRPPSEPAIRVATPTARGRVLVVDDEVLFANALSRVFSTEHDVTIVHNGRLALDRIAAGERFDAIVCDVTMPEMTGTELHATLTRTAPELAERMIFVTGGPVPELLRRVETFEKPCDVAKLRDAVRRRVVASRGQ